jgi:hypothetical protein
MLFERVVGPVIESVLRRQAAERGVLAELDEILGEAPAATPEEQP